MNNLRRRCTKMELADTGDEVGVSMVQGNNNYMENVKRRSRTRYTNWKRLATQLNENIWQTAIIWDM